MNHPDQGLCIHSMLIGCGEKACGSKAVAGKSVPPSLFPPRGLRLRRLMASLLLCCLCMCIASNSRSLLAGDQTILTNQRKDTAMEKVLIIVGDASETMDTLYPYYRLIEAGFQPVVAAPEKRRYQMVLHEVKPGWTITKEWEGYTIEADIAFRDVKPEEYLGIFFSGGRAPEYIRYDEDLVRITRHFFEHNKPTACVCHGVEIPAYAGCVKGRRMATVPKCRFDLEVCGGIFVDAPCVVDGNLISGRTWQDHGHYIGPWIKLLESARQGKLAAR